MNVIATAPGPPALRVRSPRHSGTHGQVPDLQMARFAQLVVDALWRPMETT